MPTLSPSVDFYLREVHASITKSLARRNKPVQDYPAFLLECTTLGEEVRRQKLGA